MARDDMPVFTFHNLIIGLGGEFQGPNENIASWIYGEGKDGMFRAAEILAGMGYNVYMFNEDAVAWPRTDDPPPATGGDGDAFDSIVRATMRNSIEAIAVYGYSHGGGSSYNLLSKLDADESNWGISLNRLFLAYVDAVKEDASMMESASPQTEQPPNSGDFFNFYQKEYLTGLHGDWAPNATNQRVRYYFEVPDPIKGHGLIDDDVVDDGDFDLIAGDELGLISVIRIKVPSPNSQ